MSKLHVEIDYIKIAQWMKMIDFYQQKIVNELDRAVIEQKGKVPNRRNGVNGRRKEDGIKACPNCAE